MRKLIIGVSLGLMLAGCQDKVKSVDYYKAHEAEAQAVLVSCSNSSAERDGNCANANAAISQLDQSKMQNSVSNVKW